MKRVTIAAFIISILLTAVASGQERKNATKAAVAVPPEIISPVVAYQPDCPLRIEDVKLLQFVEGGGTSQFLKVRNTGTKPIRSYTIGTWNSVGTGNEVERPLPNNLLPGEVSIPEGNEVEVVPLTKGLRDQLSLHGDMQALVVFIVVRVQFADGSVYDAAPLYNALKAHLNKLSP